MASSLASIAETWPENVLPSIGSKKLHFVQKILLVDILTHMRPEVIFCAFAQFFAGIGPAHFPAETTRLLGRGCLPFSPSFSRCKVTKRKIGTVTFCHYLSPFVTFLQDAFSRCKVTKRKFGTVRICPHMSGNVRICPHFFFAAKLRKRKLSLSSFVQLCPFVSIYVQQRLAFTLQSYEIEIWQCPNLSNYVQICPFSGHRLDLERV